MAASFVSPVPATANEADAGALFASLLEFRWRDVSFPTAGFHTRLRQDLAIHKFADRDGAHIESTGRAPLEIRARIPFINGLLAGANETWQRPLYPFTWRKFFAACADKTSGTLQHPELGPITCKVETCDVDWNAAVRGGVWVDATWIETDDTGLDLENDLAAPSPAAQVAAAAGDLDRAIANASPIVTPTLPKEQFSFSDLAFAIRGVIDVPTMVTKDIGGRIDNLLYESNTILQALQGADSNALNWPMYDAVIKLQSAGRDLKQLQLNKGRAVALYTTTVDQPLWLVAQNIPAPLDDVMTLNPRLISFSVVPRDTVVRYYKTS